MSASSGIEWTDATWNPIVGCSVVSPGCTNCYATRMAYRIRSASEATTGKSHYCGTVRMHGNLMPVWTGKVALAPDHILTAPLRWKKPRRIFVNSMGDLFHESVPDGWIMAVFDVMWRTPHHTYQVLTKRPKRMRDFIAKWHDLAGEDFENFKDARGPDAVRKSHPSGRGQLFAAFLDTLLERSGGRIPDGAAWPTFDWMQGMMWWPNVAGNVWLGVSAEDQSRYDERKDDLRSTPAAIRFFSFEPLIGPIVGDYFGDWSIVGGESGPSARPMHPNWARSLRDQCAAAGVPFFFKQWGEWSAADKVKVSGGAIYKSASNGGGGAASPSLATPTLSLNDALFVKVGKARAGRLLDGAEHNGMPEARP